MTNLTKIDILFIPVLIPVLPLTVTLALLLSGVAFTLIELTEFETVM